MVIETCMPDENVKLLPIYILVQQANFVSIYQNLYSTRSSVWIVLCRNR